MNNRFRRPSLLSLPALAVALASGLALVACTPKAKSSSELETSRQQALESPDGRTHLFALMGAADSDLQSLDAQVDSGAEYARPERHLPVCFFKATGLTRSQVRLIGESPAGLSALPPETRARAVVPLRSSALDLWQAETLVSDLARDLGLAHRAVEAIFASTVTGAAEVGVDNMAYQGLVAGLGSRATPVTDSAVDFSDVSCASFLAGPTSASGASASGQGESLSLASFSPGALKTGLITFYMMAGFVNGVDTGIVGLFSKGTGSALSGPQKEKLVKAKSAMALVIDEKNVAKHIGKALIR